MIYAKKRKLKILHLSGISANFCCFNIGDLSPLLPEPVTYNRGLIIKVNCNYFLHHTVKQVKNACMHICIVCMQECMYVCAYIYIRLFVKHFLESHKCTILIRPE